MPNKIIDFYATVSPVLRNQMRMSREHFGLLYVNEKL